MATIKHFEDLEIWQLARQLNKDIHPFLQSLNEAKQNELHKQMDRSVGSIMDNIAEGFERDGTRELIQFLSVSKGSSAEARSQLYRALDRSLINEQQFIKFQTDLRKIEEKIARFMNYLKNSNVRGKKFNTNQASNQK